MLWTLLCMCLCVSQILPTISTPATPIRELYLLIYSLYLYKKSILNIAGIIVVPRTDLSSTNIHTSLSVAHIHVGPLYRPASPQSVYKQGALALVQSLLTAARRNNPSPKTR